MEWFYVAIINQNGIVHWFTYLGLGKIKCELTGEKKVNEQEATSGPLLKSFELSPLFYCALKPVDTTSADSEKQLKDMPSKGHKKLIVLLEPLQPLGNDYRRLADRMGYSNEYIKYLGSTNEPVQTLINEKGDMKIVKLISLSKDMDRLDVAEELQEILSRFCLYMCFLFDVGKLLLFEHFCIVFLVFF